MTDVQDLKTAPLASSYLARVVKALGKLGTGETENPDAKHNTGRTLGEYFMWNEVRKYAEARADAAYERLVTSGQIEDTKTLPPGNHVLAKSPHFALTVSVSAPVRRFNGQELAKLLFKSKYKVPTAWTAEALEQAKVGTSPQVKRAISETV